MALRLRFQADLSESLGLKDYMGVMYFITLMENVAPMSDERVAVTEERLDGVQVVVYQPKGRAGATELRRAIIYLHGGGWCLGSSSKSACRLLQDIKGCFHHPAVRMKRTMASIGANQAF